MCPDRRWEARSFRGVSFRLAGANAPLDTETHDRRLPQQADRKNDQQTGESLSHRTPPLFSLNYITPPQRLANRQVLLKALTQPTESGPDSEQVSSGAHRFRETMTVGNALPISLSDLPVAEMWSPVTTKQLTNTSYIQSPRLQTAILILFS